MVNNTKVAEVTQAIIDILSDSSAGMGDVDGLDTTPEVTANPEVYTFGMHAWVDYNRPEKGQIVYKVTVSATYIPDGTDE